MRVLITGVTGFLGAELARQCLAAGWEVFGLARSPQPQTHNLGALRYEQVALTDAAALADCLLRVKPEIVFHLAAITEPRDDLQQLALVNVGGAHNLFQAAQMLASAPLVFLVSSSAVYGAARSDTPRIDEQTPLVPVTPYAQTKVMLEQLALTVEQTKRVAVIRVRPFNIVGPGQPAKYAFSAFARQLVRIEAHLQPPILETGELTAARDFVDVRDVASACIALVRSGEPGTAYNICSGVATSMREGLDLLVKLSGLGTNLTIRERSTSNQMVNVPAQLGDFSRLQTHTGWTPTYQLQQSLSDLLDDWRQRLKLGQAL
ncbi:MAG: NAD-dependent epimerase/dehydratase family protein [Chloroflexales bacterium]